MLYHSIMHPTKIHTHIHTGAYFFASGNSGNFTEAASFSKLSFFMTALLTVSYRNKYAHTYIAKTISRFK